jgi:hypothetical protein
MPDQPDQIRRTVTSRQERKELLALACEVDRVSWIQACQPSRQAGLRVVGDLLGYIEPFTHLLPNRLGGLLRGATFLTQLGRQFGWLRF